MLSVIGGCVAGHPAEGALGGGVEAGTTASRPDAPERGESRVGRGVPIIVAHDESIFPELWRTAPISARAEPLDEVRARHARGVIEAAVRKYPPNVLAEHVKGVYLVGRLHYSGIVAGGTNSRTHVYVAVGEVERGYTDRNIERIFHAEVSSILLRNRAGDFDESAWRAINPPGFAYQGPGTEAIRQRKARQWMREDLLEAGFLSTYSQTTPENDFNSFACLLFTGDPAVCESAAAYPRIVAKRRLTIEFYQRLDPALNEALFRSLRR